MMHGTMNVKFSHVLVTMFYTVCMGSSASLSVLSFPMELFRQPRVFLCWR